MKLLKETWIGVPLSLHFLDPFGGTVGFHRNLFVLTIGLKIGTQGSMKKSLKARIIIINRKLINIVLDDYTEELIMDFLYVHICKHFF